MLSPSSVPCSVRMVPRSPVASAAFTCEMIDADRQRVIDIRVIRVQYGGNRRAEQDLRGVLCRRTTTVLERGEKRVVREAENSAGIVKTLSRRWPGVSPVGGHAFGFRDVSVWFFQNPGVQPSPPAGCVAVAAGMVAVGGGRVAVGGGGVVDVRRELPAVDETVPVADTSACSRRVPVPEALVPLPAVPVVSGDGTHAGRTARHRERPEERRRR